ncbi:PDDEXK nuclease domain-containing protein [Sphingobacterium sp. SRCM116780]|uniref:PDDEXK nuclease domain-containing protein n=1 Tax=Sphingobacterium sp. SRCM116780 TaxID=2907623 RepID=UPI001F2F0333|nr:PDDEXK nuclease domain-containing protein [Sphingobacterium sp. SRCM116780]UIR56716.1 PDDEXK nuclease domain-containing protein [Sphingobacterium sp. SRCM116780]
MSDNNRKQRGNKIEKVIFPIAESISNMPADYQSFIASLVDTIQKERLNAILSANQSMIVMYWHIGDAIIKQQTSQGWGTRVIDRMAHDLKQNFPDITGFSPRNLNYMKRFAESWPNLNDVQNYVSKLSWRSNITLVDKIRDPELRLWYAHKALENGMSRDMLVFQIESQLHLREGSAVSNFNQALPPINSDMAQQSFKDPYIFDFIGNTTYILERELEQSLIDHIQKFLLELGQGFAFVGRQVHLELGGKDFYLDLLFYHIKLKCYVVIELKTGEFDPGYVSKLNMYLNVVNDALCQPEDNPTIGLLLVKSKNKLVVEYSLNGFKNPIGVSNWESDIINSLPDKIKQSLPTIEEIENELKDDIQ